MHTCATICVHRKTNNFFTSFIISSISICFHVTHVCYPETICAHSTFFGGRKNRDSNGIQKRNCQWKQNNFNLQKKKLDGKKRLDYFSFCFRIMCNLVDWIKDYEYEWIWFVFKNSIKKFDCNGHCLFWEIYFIGNQENFGINYGI